MFYRTIHILFIHLSIKITHFSIVTVFYLPFYTFTFPILYKYRYTTVIYYDIRQ